mgnify:CR=1 FL=1
MAILTTINGIPLFSTVQEALAWAQQNGLSGYHTHTYQGSVGYMGGYTHAQATPMVTASNVRRNTSRRVINANTRQVVSPVAMSQPRVNRPSTSSGVSRGGGGY